jgi:hypothetical protein
MRHCAFGLGVVRESQEVQVDGRAGMGRGN